MKKGFTLAEVLITLAVIGVVAALTIPVLIQKYQKKQMYSQFMKVYNTLSTAMDNAVAEYGEIQDWKWAKYRYNNETFEDELVDAGDDPLNNYLLPQLKYVKKCDKMSDCFASEYTYLNGSDGSSEQYPEETLTNELMYDGDMEIVTVVLADGSVFATAGEKYGVYFAVDTNGKKGPNVMGRDLFMMHYNSSIHNHQPGMEFEEEWNPNSSYGDNCNPNSSRKRTGEGCGSRLLQEGAMNY